MDNIEVQVTSFEKANVNDFDAVIYDLDEEIKMLSSRADKWDIIVAAASGILCSMLDVLWVGDFSLDEGRSFASDKVDEFVEKTAALLGYKRGKSQSAVKFLEEKFPIPSDGNTPDFGGGLQHHLRDFGHHPTLVGLIFSLLTQFTEMSYGTDVNGIFKVVPVPDKSKAFIGNDIPNKLFNGTIIWFFHLVSDMAGSSSTAGISGGTGIPGPILSLAKELSAFPFFRNINIGDRKLSAFLAAIFNGTIFARRDENGKIIKDSVVRFDLRGELGAVAELGKQAIPVIANECFVRSFYFIRRFSIALEKLKCNSVEDIHLKNIDWDNVKPFGNPTVDRMITISNAVFSTVDITEAIVSQQYLVAVNYVGIGRFAVAIGTEIANHLKVRNVKKIKQMYENIRRNTFAQTDNKIYNRIGDAVDIEKFGLDLKQTEILYNLEMLKTSNDINRGGKTKSLKNEWLEEWKQYMQNGFSAFVNDENAVLHWYSEEELRNTIMANSPKLPWFRLVLLETMLFEPYYPLSTEIDKNGKEIPSTKYKELHIPLMGYNQSEGDKFLEGFFTESFYQKGYIKRLRKCYGKVTRELNEVLKNAIKGISITAGIAIVVIATAGAFAPAIAVALVGSNFVGLSGAALTSACLAYLGGGAIAAGGLGMAGGTAAIVGGGAVLGIGVGAGVGGTVSATGLLGKKDTILQSAKLMVSVREIFLNDEHDIEYSNTIYEQYVRNIADIEKDLVELKLKSDVADKEEKKRLKKQINDMEKSVQAMKIAMKSMNRFNSSFSFGASTEQNQKGPKMLDFIEVNTQSSIRIADEKVIYCDPLDIPAERHDADIILITHAHYDHYSAGDIQKVMKDDTVIVCPKTMTGASELGISVKLVSPNEKFEISGICFETIPAYNNIKPFHPKSNGWVGYIINSKQNGRIYISGDTDVTEENKQVKCRIALVPIGGHFTMNAEKASMLINTIKPEFAVPTHYGSIVGKPEDAEVFCRNVDESINVVIKLPKR